MPRLNTRALEGVRLTPVIIPHFWSCAGMGSMTGMHPMQNFNLAVSGMGMPPGEQATSASWRSCARMLFQLTAPWLKQSMVHLAACRHADECHSWHAGNDGPGRQANATLLSLRATSSPLLPLPLIQASNWYLWPPSQQGLVCPKLWCRHGCGWRECGGSRWPGRHACSDGCPCGRVRL